MNSQDSTPLERQGKAKDVAPAPPKIDAATLAHLVAQPRFNSLPNSEAISAALSLLSDCQTALRRDDVQSVSEESDKFLVPRRFPMPARFPATLEDFYRLIVKAKKGEAQPHFRDFLRHQIKADENVRLANLVELRKQLKIAENQIAQAAKDGTTVTQAPTQDFVEGMKKSIAEHESHHFDDNAVDAALDVRFNRYVRDGIDHINWHILCDTYPRWWLPEKTARKRAAGRARAKKAAAVQKKRRSTS